MCKFDGSFVPCRSAGSFIQLHVNRGERSWILNFLPHTLSLHMMSYTPGILHAAFLQRRIVRTSITVWLGTRFLIPNHVKVHVLAWITLTKYHTLGSLNNANLLLTALEAVSLRSRFQPIQFPLRAICSPQVLMWPFLGERIHRETE